MSKVQYQGSKLCCSECGKNQAKFREFVGAWLCNACYQKFELAEREKAEKINRQTARNKNKKVKIEKIEEEPNEEEPVIEE